MVCMVSLKTSSTPENPSPPIKSHQILKKIALISGVILSFLKYTIFTYGWNPYTAHISLFLRPSGKSWRIHKLCSVNICIKNHKYVEISDIAVHYPSETALRSRCNCRIFSEHVAKSRTEVVESDNIHAAPCSLNAVFPLGCSTGEIARPPHHGYEEL